MTRFATFLSLLLALPLAAQQADLSVTPSTPASVQTGEVFTATLRIRNNGPDEARNPRMTFRYTTAPVFLEVTAPTPWLCGSSDGIDCTAQFLDAGAEVVITARILAPNTPVSPWRATAIVGSDTPDPTPRNAIETATAIVPSSTRADLAVVSSAPAVAREGEGIPFEVVIRNDGPDTARNVTVIVESTHSAPNAVGHGYVCTQEPRRSVCTQAVLGAPQNFLLSGTLRAPDSPGSVGISARIVAEGVNDPNISNNITFVSTSIGNAEDWERILVPLNVLEFQGAFGSRWTTDLWVQIESDTDAGLGPLCHQCIILSPPRPLPLRRAFRADHELLNPPFTTGDVLGTLMYVPRENSNKVRFNLRVRDLTRQGESAGTEVPVIRESELATERISLLNVPVDAGFRHLIRVYDADARPGAQVLVTVFDAEGTQPLRVFLHTFTVRENNNTVTTAQLPFRPGYLQFELPAIAGLRNARIDIEPLTPGLRFWGFASVTNNTTNQVTVISPQ